MAAVSAYYIFLRSGKSKTLESNAIQSIKEDSSEEFVINLGNTKILSKDFFAEIESVDKKLIINGDGIKHIINTSDFNGQVKEDMTISLKSISERENRGISSILSKKSDKQYEVEGFLIGKKSGGIGFKTQASFQVGNVWKGKEANVYRYDDKSKQYFFISKVLVDHEGIVSFDIYRYGKYFLASSEAPRYDEEKVKLVYEEEFNESGRPNKERWKYDIGGSGWGNEEKQCYTDELSNAKVEDGKLIITARKEEYAFNEYTSARLLSKDSWLYGRFEVKAKLPKGVGTWPAIWMMPKESVYGSWPNSGEIDIMEHVGFEHGLVHATTHSQKYYWKVNTQKSGQIKVDNVDSEYHVYSMEWTPHKIDFFVDGEKYFTTEYDLVNDREDGWKAWPFDKPYYLILNIAVGGSWGGQKGIDDSIFPQAMEVDYVRVYDLGIESQIME